MSLRVLVVDPSAASGRITKQALESIPGIEVSGVCRDSRSVLERVRSASPDVVTLQLDMPFLSGLEALQSMRREGIRTPAIMVGEPSAARDLPARAKDMCVLDVIEKPLPGDSEGWPDILRERLTPLLSAAAHRKEVLSILSGGKTPSLQNGSAAFPDGNGAIGRTPSAPATEVERAPEVRPRRSRARMKPAMVLIGVSTGGPEALARIIPALPGTLRVPVLIVQHMPPLFTQNLAQKLDSSSALRVKEAEDGELAMQGSVYIAPGGKHLKVMAGGQNEIVLRTTSDPPENNCRPAVDVLFRSAAAAFPGLSVAVILTGMGRDGTLGLRDLREAGVLAIAQDEASCTVFGMPKEAIQAGLVDIVTPLPSVANEILKAVS